MTVELSPEAADVDWQAAQAAYDRDDTDINYQAEQDAWDAMADLCQDCPEDCTAHSYCRQMTPRRWKD